MSRASAVVVSLVFAPVAMLVLAGIVVQLMLSRDARQEYRHDIEGEEEGD